MATNTWSRVGSAGVWSTNADWSLGHKPAAGEDVVFDGTSVQNCTMDEASAALGTFTLAVGYTGTFNDGGQTILHRHDVSLVSLTYADHDLSTKTYAGPIVLIECNAAGGAFTVALPAYGLAERYLYIFKKIDATANAVTVQAATGETIR